jgi:hypothetical protein
MNWVITCLAISSDLSIDYDWLITAINSTDSLKVMMLGTELKLMLSRGFLHHGIA